MADTYVNVSVAMKRKSRQRKCSVQESAVNVHLRECKILMMRKE